MKNFVSAREITLAIPVSEYYRFEIPSMPTPRRSHGWVPGGLCPFHDDRHRGNFHVNLDTGAFKCFACDAHGDLIAFCMQRYGLSFSEALRELERNWL